jgi:hypothetical protein
MNVDPIIIVAVALVAFFSGFISGIILVILTLKRMRDRGEI